MVILGGLGQFSPIFTLIIKCNSVRVPIKIIEVAETLIDIPIEITTEFRSYILKTRCFFKCVLNPETQKMAKKAHNLLAFSCKLGLMLGLLDK